MSLSTEPDPLLPDGRATEGRRVLVVDDSPALGPLTARLLAEMGLHATWTSTLSRALEHLARETYDTVVADCAVAEGGVAEMVALLKRSAPVVPPLVLLTNRDDVSGGSDGRTVWLSKPFASAQLRDALEMLGVSVPQGPGRQS